MQRVRPPMLLPLNKRTGRVIYDLRPHVRNDETRDRKTYPRPTRKWLKNTNS